MAKKNYEKPELKGEKLFEAGAVTNCCKLTNGTCSNNLKNTNGKANRAGTTS